MGQLIINNQGFSCEGMRRYDLPAPFLKRRKFFLNVYYQRITYLHTGTFFEM